ncbi:hypothetical protein [Prevotellamassilia timonensis]|uniref:hypothetical protein n=1 Tax=Prevotellamassilia timonensis TaxID=1852370 RepID=UPI0023F3E202|nr:hypothetical protein [Prevotellamassilia timonensis]MDD7440062.1 hypothetical protein [Prevotellamassilia timonensis]
MIKNIVQMKKGKHDITNNELLHKLVDDFDAEHVNFILETTLLNVSSLKQGMDDSQLLIVVNSVSELAIELANAENRISAIKMLISQ